MNAYFYVLIFLQIKVKCHWNRETHWSVIGFSKDVSFVKDTVEYTVEDTMVMWENFDQECKDSRVVVVPMVTKVTTVTWGWSLNGWADETRRLGEPKMTNCWNWSWNDYELDCWSDEPMGMVEYTVESWVDTMDSIKVTWENCWNWSWNELDYWWSEKIVDVVPIALEDWISSMRWLH